MSRNNHAFTGAWIAALTLCYICQIQSAKARELNLSVHSQTLLDSTFLTKYQVIEFTCLTSGDSFFFYFTFYIEVKILFGYCFNEFSFIHSKKYSFDYNLR